MAVSNFSLDRVRTEILNGAGLARTNRFEVIITPPPGLNSGSVTELVSMYVEQASLPLLNIFTKSFKIFGPSYQRPLSSEYGGEGLPITFHVDREMTVRKFFEDWMHLIVRPEVFTVAYQEDYITDIIIRQLDEQENITHEITLYEAFPRNMNLMDLNNSASNQTHRLNVLFAYRYWKTTSSGGANFEQQGMPVPRNFLNPQVPVSDNLENRNVSLNTNDTVTGNPMGDVSGYGNGW